MAATLPGVDPILKVSIIPRGIGALGYTMQRPTEDRFLLAESDLKNRIAVLMGGRAAENLIFDGDVSTGAADDLQRASEMATEMVTRFGMDETIGQRSYSQTAPTLLDPSVKERINAAEATVREIDLAVRQLIEAGFQRASDILRSRRQDLDAGAKLLLEHETLTAEDFPPIQSRS